MKKVKKNFFEKQIVVIGLGSIGQRHYNNLINLGFKNVFAYDIDAAKLKKVDKKFQITNINRNQLSIFDAAIICTPNNLHIRTAINAAMNGCDLFIEKPLSNSLNSISNLIRLCKKNNLISLVACNMRFHPCLQFIKKYLESSKLGDIYNIFFEFGFYLPDWRPDYDYRINYAAKKKTGGGIILDDIHEFDLLFWLNNFEKIIESKFLFNRSGDLDIDTEDNCVASFKFKNEVLGLVKCDYLQKQYSRSCKIVGEKGNLYWDFNQNIVELRNDRGTEVLFKLNNFNLNKIYSDELLYFFECLDERKKTFNSIEEAEKILKICVERK